MNLQTATWQHVSRPAVNEKFGHHLFVKTSMSRECLVRKTQNRGSCHSGHTRESQAEKDISSSKDNSVKQSLGHPGENLYSLMNRIDPIRAHLRSQQRLERLILNHPTFPMPLLTRQMQVSPGYLTLSAKSHGCDLDIQTSEEAERPEKAWQSYITHPFQFPVLLVSRRPCQENATPSTDLGELHTAAKPRSGSPEINGGKQHCSHIQSPKPSFSSTIVADAAVGTTRLIPLTCCSNSFRALTGEVAYSGGSLR